MRSNTRRSFLGSLTAVGAATDRLPTTLADQVHLEDDVSKLWSKPVNGVRARLIATQDEFTLDHPTSLIMLFQNIGNTVVELVGGVNVMPTVAMEGEHPYVRDHDFNTAIWMTSRVKRLEPLWGLRAQMRELNPEPQVTPGDIYLAIVKIAPVRVQGEERLRHNQILETRDAQRKRARLAVTEPGEYLLGAAWRPEGLAASSRPRRSQIAKPWQGSQIDFPQIKVRIVSNDETEEVFEE